MLLMGASHRIPEFAVHAAFSTAEVIFATIGGLRGAISLILAQVGSAAHVSHHLHHHTLVTAALQC